jgi:arylsulfatase A
MIETDHHVGRVLRFLDEAGLAETTLVVFTSDNGPENSWKERMATHGHDSRGGWRGGKRSIYEGGHRVPFIVRWPAGIREPGRRWNGVVGQVDLLATVAEIVGLEQLPAAVGEDSQSFAQVLTDPAATPARLPLINHAANGRFAITEGHWKLVLPHRQAPAELYHLHEDPVEARNVIEAHRVIAERLEKRATEIVCRGRTTEGAWQANDTGYWQDLAWLTEEAYEKTLRQGRTVPNGDTTQD